MQRVPASPRRFELTFDRSFHQERFSGRVYLFFSRGNPEPRLALNWFNPAPFVALDVEDVGPDEVIEFDLDSEDLLTFPRDFDAVDISGHFVQAVIRFNPNDPNVSTGVGNGVSQVERLLGQSSEKPLLFRVRRLLPAVVERESDWSKVFKVRSRLLSEFAGRDVYLQSTVLLPASYPEQRDRRYPVIFNIPGFGGRHHRPPRRVPLAEENDRGVEFLRVVLDPQCPLGHHVFADSANNGPWQKAFLTEYLPAFEEEFRVLRDPGARLLTGHSSGGWSSLWMQVTNPDDFGGVWSTAPDPVDFRDFQKINLYEPGANMYVDAAGNRRPLARRDAHETLLWYDSFAWMEHVLGPGGQLHSFEAVFSPRGNDGRPLPVFDRETGAVDPQVSAAWTAYDIRLVIEDHWSELGPRLAGKLRVHMGTQDTFLLEGATRLLRESLQEIGSDAIVELHPGKDHSSLMTPALKKQIYDEMVAAALRVMS